MADEQAIDPVEGRNRIGVRHTCTGLDLRKERGETVRRLELLLDRTGYEAVVQDLHNDPAVTLRRKLDAVEDVACLLRRFDLWQHDPLGANIQGTGDVMVFLRRRPNDRRQVRGLCVP